MSNLQLLKYPFRNSELQIYVKEGKDAQWYNRAKIHEEIHSPMYDVIKSSGFTTFVDVGTNYGLIATLAGCAGLKVICVEGDPTLNPIIIKNLALNQVVPEKVFAGIAADCDNTDSSFSLNATSSLDNRVSMEKWHQVTVSSVRLDTLVKPYFDAGEKVFLKIDTQGYEKFVLNGFAKYWRKTGWLAKIEFAPLWLESQKTDPVDFLSNLCSNFEVAEFPERIPYQTNHVDEFFASGAIPKRDAEAFVKYVTQLNANGRGWLDLVLRPIS